MTGRKDTTLTIRIPADLKERGSKVARADGYSLSTAIEIFITQYIAFAKKHGTADGALPGTVLGKLLRK